MTQPATALQPSSATQLVPVVIDFEFQQTGGPTRIWPREIGAVILLPDGKTVSFRRQMSPYDNTGSLIGNWTDEQKEANEARKQLPHARTVLHEFKDLITSYLLAYNTPCKPLFVFHDFRNDLNALRNVAAGDKALEALVPEPEDLADTQLIHTLAEQENRRLGLSRAAHVYETGDKQQPKGKHNALQDARITAATLVGLYQNGAKGLDPRPFTHLARTLKAVEQAVQQKIPKPAFTLGFHINRRHVTLLHSEASPQQMLEIRSLLCANGEPPRVQRDKSPYLSKPNVRHTQVHLNTAMGKLAEINAHLEETCDIAVDKGLPYDETLYVPDVPAATITSTVSVSDAPDFDAEDQLPPAAGLRKGAEHTPTAEIIMMPEGLRSPPVAPPMPPQSRGISTGLPTT
jgi:hypothetical protein